MDTKKIIFPKSVHSPYKRPLNTEVAMPHQVVIAAPNYSVAFENEEYFIFASVGQ